MAKVSIIVPVYNVRDYLPMAVESLLRQTERDIEIILVDDGSTDDSGAMCDAYAAKDLRIKVIHKDNGGLSSARNAGAEQAAADYIMFLDGDDYLLDNTIARLLEVAGEYPCDFVQFLFQELQPGAEASLPASTEQITQVCGPRECFELLYALGGAGASSCTKMIRAELVRAFPFRSIRHEDEQWCTEAFQKDLTVTYLPEPMYVYVQRANSIITGNFNNAKLQLFRVIHERIKALEKLNLAEMLHFEYEKLFFAVLRLHCEAKAAGDERALLEINKEFQDHKKEIKRYGKLQGKYKLLFTAMTRMYGAVSFYELYQKTMRSILTYSIWDLFKLHNEGDQNV